MAQVLIIDDDAFIRSLLEKIIVGDGHRVTTAYSGEEALELIRHAHFDVIICDVGMQPIDGLTVLRNCNEHDKETPVIMVSAKSDVNTELQATKYGAYDYITKPVKLDQFLDVFRHCIKYLRLEGNVDTGLIPYVTHPRYKNYIAESPAIKRIFARIQQISGSNVNYMIRGEYGSGRRSLAQLIYKQQMTGKSCLHEIGCLYYPESITESVIYGGVRNDKETHNKIKRVLLHISSESTLCITDAEQLPDISMELLLGIHQDTGIWEKYPPRTVKTAEEKELLRRQWRQKMEMPFRLVVICRSGLKPDHMPTENGRDFMTCCSTTVIDLPPLRERKEDILPLSYYFLHQALPEGYPMPHMSRDLQLALEAYTWPANLAELRETMAFMLRNGIPSELVPNMLPDLTQVSIGMLPSCTLAESSMEAYRCHVLRTLLYAHMQKAKKGIPRHKTSTSGTTFEI